LQKTKVAIYGLTTEGYSLASRMVEKASVTIVDDTLQMAMDLDAQMVKSNRTLGQLLGEESLLGLKPISQVLSEARVILFTPKLRKTGDESIIESNGKMREVAKHISKGTTVINVLPVGAGGNIDNISLIEKQTGMKVGETLNYGYCPVKPGGEPSAVASFARMGDKVTPEEVGLKSTEMSMAALELSHVSSVLNESTSIAAEIELMRKARGQRVLVEERAEMYIDDLAGRIYDLTAIQSSEDVGEPLTYMAGAALKSLENHVRYIVEETRELLREMQLKASKTRVVVAWTVDKYEMRADRSRTAERLGERLRDYVTDVRHGQMPARKDEVLDSYKHNVAIACSDADYGWVKGMRGGAHSMELSILRATPSLQKG
jgi:hypothetical protein